MTNLTNPSVNPTQGKTAEFPEADSPLKLAKKDWIAIFKRVKDEVDNDQIGMVAAATAYYALFSIFPLLIAMVSIYGFISDPNDLVKQIQALYRFIPKDAASVIATQLNAIVNSPRAALGMRALISICVALYSASAGTKALMEGMNIAYDESEKRGFIRLQWHALLLTLGAVFGIVVTVGTLVVLPIIFKFIGFGSFTNTLMLVIRWPLLALIFTFGLAVVNRWGPSRNKAKWRWVSVGAATGTVMILAVSAGLAFYVSKFGSYNATYGSISGVIILLLWFYLVSYAILISGELNSEIEHQTLRDTTIGPDKPMGSRGAVVADTKPGDNQERALNKADADVKQPVTRPQGASALGSAPRPQGASAQDRAAKPSEGDAGILKT